MSRTSIHDIKCSQCPCRVRLEITDVEWCKDAAKYAERIAELLRFTKVGDGVVCWRHA